MRVQDLERVRELHQHLEEAQRTLAKFQNAKEEHLPCRVFAGGCDLFLAASVDLPPVPKSVAVSAAQRRVSKLVSELQALGVSV